MLLRVVGLIIGVIGVESMLGVATATEAAHRRRRRTLSGFGAFFH